MKINTNSILLIIIRLLLIIEENKYWAFKLDF